MICSILPRCSFLYESMHRIGSLRDPLTSIFYRTLKIQHFSIKGFVTSKMGMIVGIIGCTITSILLIDLLACRLFGQYDQTINQNRTELTIDPENIEKLDHLDDYPSLKSLTIFGGDIMDIPDLRQLSSLQELSIFNCPIEDIPDSLGQLSSLKKLSIVMCPITTIPESLFRLPPTCEINLQNCRIPERTLRRVQGICNNENYIGPRFVFSISDLEQISETLESTDVLIGKFYGYANIPLKDFSSFTTLNSQNKELLLNWLNKLRAFPKDLQALWKSIIQTLEVAERDSTFRDAFWACALEGYGSCPDRTLLSIIRAKMNRDLAIASQERDIQKLSEALRKLWISELLHECASNKAKTLKAVDPIETHLIYPAKLGKFFNLSLDYDQMLFERCSGVKEPDLETAKTFVIEHLGNRETVIKHLINHEEWKNFLKYTVPEYSRLYACFVNGTDPSATVEKIEAEGYRLTDELLTQHKISFLSVMQAD